MGLEDPSQETLREVETAHPIAERSLVMEPFSDEGDSGQHVLEPRGKRFEGGV